MTSRRANSRHEISRDERRIRDRLVHVPQELRQQRDDVGLDQDLVVIGAEPRRDRLRVRQLVVEVVGVAAAEADRIGLHRAAAVLRHQADDGARVDPAGQERADRHVAHHLHPDRFLESRTDPRRPVVDARRAIDRARRSASSARSAMRPFSTVTTVAGGSFRDAAEDRARRSHVAELQIPRDGVLVERRRDAGQREQRLRLRREGETAAVGPRVDRLDAEAVAADQQPAPIGIPQREAVHPVEPVDERRPELAIERDDDLAIRMREKRWPRPSSSRRSSRKL